MLLVYEQKERIVVMVRLATIEDAEQLNSLNEEFNGKGETTLENVKNSLADNQQEVIVVAEIKNRLVGFVCVQLKKSFCYDDYMPELTEVYVKPEHREKGIANKMIRFAEEYCSKTYSLHKFELLTGKENNIAQIVYEKLGYEDDGELHLSKRVKR